MTELIIPGEIRPLVVQGTARNGRNWVSAHLATVVLTACMTATFPLITEAQEKAKPPVLGPGDVIRLKIWREPDLSGDIQVNEHGQAVFPGLGRIQVTDISADSLEDFLTRRYSDLLKDPVIDATPLRRISILGAVKNPGLYPIDPTITLGEAIAVAGGATPEGNQDKIRLIRDRKEVDVQLRGDLKVMDSPVRSGDQLFIPARGWINRNPAIIAAAITGAALLAATLLR